MHHVVFAYYDKSGDDDSSDSCSCQHHHLDNQCCLRIRYSPCLLLLHVYVSSSQEHIASRRQIEFVLWQITFINSALAVYPAIKYFSISRRSSSSLTTVTNSAPESYKPCLLSHSGISGTIRSISLGGLEIPQKNVPGTLPVFFTEYFHPTDQYPMSPAFRCSLLALPFLNSDASLPQYMVKSPTKA